MKPEEDEIKKEEGRVMYLLADFDRVAGFSLLNGYYTGKSYVFLGERYAIVEGLEKAKRYSSRKRAERACKTLCFCNNSFSVVERVEGLRNGD